MAAGPTILVLDSGAGGLSVSREILSRIPHCHLIYLADNAAFPYGTKTATELEARLLQLMSEHIPARQPDLVVVACNTASTLVLDSLRKVFPKLPFVGVVPAIKPAAKHSKTGVIGVLATPATVQREYTNQLIQEFAPHLQVLRHGSDRLVHLAEGLLRTQSISEAQLAHELDALLNQPQGDAIDTIVLACTHFPILKQKLNAIVAERGRTIHWIDSGEAIARRVYSLLMADAKFKSGDSFTHTCVLTKPDEYLKTQYLRYLSSGSP